MVSMTSPTAQCLHLGAKGYVISGCREIAKKMVSTSLACMETMETIFGCRIRS
jgi:hypothetical protein